MEESEIDGVTVAWRERPGPLRATLAFGVGIRDETLDSLGVTDAVAALTTPNPRSAARHGSSETTVDVDVTTFELTGSPDKVATWLAGLCAALSSPPLDRMAAITDAAADGRMTEPDTAGTLLLHRYGLRGPGLARWSTPRYAGLTPETIRRYAGEYFVAGNAALMLTGPPPSGLHLPLPAGPRPERPMAEPVSPNGPQWFDTAGAEVYVALRCGRGLRWLLAHDVLWQRLLRAVDDAGLRYRVYQWDVDVDPHTSEMLFGLVPARRRAAQPQRAAELLWQELRRLAADPPTVEEIAAAQARLSDEPSPDDLMDDDDIVAAVLYGLPPLYGPNLRTALATVTQADLHEVAVGWSQSALLVVPESVRPDLPGMLFRGCTRGGIVPEGTRFRRPVLHRLVSANARAERLILGFDSISRVDPTGLVHAIRFADIMIAEENDDARVVYGRDGCVINVDPQRFPGARRVVRMIDDRVLLPRRPLAF